MTQQGGLHDRTIDAFDKVMQARRTNAICREVADRYFFETVVRLHRAGEGAPFTGLKPSGPGHTHD